MLMGASEEEQQDDSSKTVDTTDTMESFVTIAVNESNSVAGKKVERNIVNGIQAKLMVQIGVQLLFLGVLIRQEY